MHAKSWKTVWVVVGGATVCVALIWASVRWPKLLSAPGAPGDAPVSTQQSPSGLGAIERQLEQIERSSAAAAQRGAPTLHPSWELLKLVIAAVLGMLVTAVHKRYHRDKPMTRSMEQAQILLCVSGAMMMIVIGNSLARALGVAGAVGLIRFRTPVEDPKDTTLLFLLAGLGMSCGLGAFAVAALGTIFLCVFLVILDQFGEEKPRAMMLGLVAEAKEFPTAHVQSVFAQHGIVFEPREVSQAVVKYHVILDPGLSLEDLSARLMSGGTSGIKSVTWEAPKKSG